MSTVHEKLNEFLSKRLPDEPIENSFLNNLTYRLVKDQYTSTPLDYYKSLAYTLRDRLAKRWLETQQTHHKKDVKRAYYLSMEFLIGRLLKMNVDRLNLGNSVKDLFAKLGIDFETIEEIEPDSGLGNGGLGRLAACFLDSIATLGIPCFGYGIRYDYGLFRQKIINGYQVEVADKWLADGYPWEIERPERYTIQYHGNSQKTRTADGKEVVEWVNSNNVIAIPYDIPVPGFLNNTVNTLRLWAAKSDDEFGFEIFNNGDYVNAYMEKINDENVSKVLYPNDNTYAGRELRLKQEFFFSSASLQDILRRFKEKENYDFKEFPEKAVIQLNDTHPSVAIPELLRLLIDKEGLSFDEAWNITKKSFAYTNHTLMPEALERWPEKMFGFLLPRHLELIYLINETLMNDIRAKYGPDFDRMRRMSIIEEGTERMVRMAYLAVVGSFSVNGVSELHSELLKSHLLSDFYDIYPKRFHNVTNGITHRRWLYKCNPRLAHLVTSKVGGEWLTDLKQLKGLENHLEDPSFKEGWQIIKRNNKIGLSNWLYKHNEVSFNPDSLFDVQVKRIHEYKRQLMNILHVIYMYLVIKNHPAKEIVPRTVLFAGKAAPAYQMAKLHIKLINSIAHVINNDPKVSEKLKVYFIPNYNVSTAEKIIPATDLSEQISLAGTEASGTGNMKFALNGALTIGTLDGANVEIMQEVGKENIFIFGLKAPEVEDLKKKNYNPKPYIEKNEILKEIMQLIQTGFFEPGQPEIFRPIYNSLTYQDPFMVIADFESYIKCQERVSDEFLDKDKWARKSIINVANMGKFSSDRSITDYNKNIWKITPIINGKT
ncbi:MAG: glycogen/starch/alpha-glucan phosphorylase [Candidatus Margulisbacteria bacterium]|nr:glycogen/starch/alpha-glucan phosphorylase [Candidatus Margulisiibacteriota bacterium]